MVRGEPATQRCSRSVRSLSEAEMQTETNSPIHSELWAIQKNVFLHDFILAVPLWQKSESPSLLDCNGFEFSIQLPQLGRKDELNRGWVGPIVYVPFLTKGPTAVRWDHYPPFQNAAAAEDIQMQLWKHFAGHFEGKPTYSFGPRVRGSLFPELTPVTSLLLRP